MKKPYKKKILTAIIVLVVLFVFILLLCLFLPRPTLPESIKGYAQGHAYVPIRSADSYYENYHVVNVWK